MKFFRIILCLLISIALSCSGDSSSNKSNSYSSSSSSNVQGTFNLLDDYPALQDAFTNTDEVEQSTIDPYEFNQFLADALSPDVEHVTEILPFIQDTREPLAGTMVLVRSILERIIHQDDYDWPSDPYTNYTNDFYTFLDDLSAAQVGVSEDIVTLLKKVVSYIYYVHGSEAETVMDDLIAFLQDTEGQNVGTMLPLLQEGLGKLLLQANTTFKVGGQDTKLGNAVNGVDAILSATKDIAQNDVYAREELYEIIREVGKLTTASAQGKNFTTILQELMVNLEDYATVGGSVYENNASYKNDSTGVGTGYYVNSELRNGIKNLWPGLVSLFIRPIDNATYAPLSNQAETNPDGESVVESLTRSLYKLRLVCGINYTNSDFAIEPSLKRMVEYNYAGQPRSNSSYKVSYLDHLMYVLAASYDYGFLTRKITTTPFNDANEPFQNNYVNNFTSGAGGLTARLHGLPTGGILTINDSLYSMKCGLKEARSSSQNFTMWWLGAYNLSLDARVTESTWDGKIGGLVTSTDLWNRGQGDYLFRSSTSFTSSQATNYKFYEGYDFPVLALLSGACVGDAGIPNGGRSGITPTSNDTTIGGNNDYRTYYPYVGNGLGELNTGRWTMGWIARACWEGEGPYYYADPNAPTTSIGGKTYYIYFRPDGRIYALVYKPNLSDKSTWQYFYPVDGGNDVKDKSNSQLGSYWLRENRYKYSWQTDHYLIRSTNINYHRDSNHAPGGWTGYYSPARVVGTTGINRFKMHSLQGTTGIDDYNDDLDASASNSGALTFWEKIPEGTAKDSNDYNYWNRECASQEEAMYRNFQWLMLEKKFVFVMPMTSYVRIRAVAAGMCTINLYIDVPVFTIIEANGLVGMATARKTGSVGTWVRLGSDGSSINRSQPNGPGGANVNYGDSRELGDGRLWVLVKEDSSYDNITLIIDGDYVDINTIWNTILGEGNVLPNIIGDNIDAIARMAFLQDTYVASNATGSTWTNAWNNRNKLLPVVLALSGDLHSKSYYKPPASGYWYNFTESSAHRYPLKNIRNIIQMLLGSLARHYKTPYTGATTGWWVPQMQVSTFSGYNGNFGFFTPKPVSTSVDFRPNSTLRSGAQLIIESGSNATALRDGLIPALANTRLVTNLIALLQMVGNNETGSIYETKNKTSSDYTQWGARQKLFFGLEQILTSIRASRSTELDTSRNYFYGISYPDWMFTVDANRGDVNLNTALDELIGSSDTDDIPEYGEKGLAVFVDGRSDANPNRNWNNYRKLVNGIGTLLSSSGTYGSTYCITEDLISIIDKVMTGFSATDEQLRALRHTLGTLLYYYDGSNWVVPNEMRDLLTWRYDGINKVPGYLPETLMAFDTRYESLLTVANNLLIDNGWVEYVATTISSSWTWEEIIEQLYDLLNKDVVTNPDSTFYDGLSERLTYFYLKMTDGDLDNDIYIRSFEDFVHPSYKFKSAQDYLYSDEFDPYNALGLILSK